GRADTPRGGEDRRAQRPGAAAAGHGLGFASADARNIVLQTLKQAEDGDGWILRLYESHGSRSDRVSLTFGLPVDRVSVCDLLENVLERLAVEDDRVHLAVGPYEVVTLRLWPAGA
ncbi:MAG TPA: glycosyl hydrolase-related protein, partial [Trueperaceae bacterium]